MRRRLIAAGLCGSAACFASLAFAAETVTYTYDALGRLVKATSAGGPVDGEQTQIGYDPAGNRATYQVADGTGGGTVTFSIANASATEGSAVVFTVTKTGTASGTLTVDYATAAGSASTSDFTSASATLSFGASETSKTFSVATTQDTTDENDEAFTVTLSNASAGSSIATATATGTIVDDDTTSSHPSFAISDASVTEGGILSFTVNKVGTTSSSYSVNYATSDGSATSGDYTAKSGTLTFSSSQTSQTVSVQTTDDTVVESAETVIVTLSGASGGATISDSSGTGTINDNDNTSLPAFSVNDVSVDEGGHLIFTITKTGTGAATIHYGTHNGTATAGSDYVDVGEYLTFASNQSSIDVAVATVEDSEPELNETVTFGISAPSSEATITDMYGTGIILNDDGAPPPNAAPVAQNDSIGVPRCTDATINLLANDSDPNGHAINLISVVRTSSGEHADVTIISDTTVMVSAHSSTGQTVFTYTIRDSLDATATATLTVATLPGQCA